MSYNIAGHSLLSENLDFEIDVYQPVVDPPQPPEPPPNKAPSFGDYTIDDIKVELKDALSGETTPNASNVRTE